MLNKQSKKSVRLTAKVACGIGTFFKRNTFSLREDDRLEREYQNFLKRNVADKEGRKNVLLEKTYHNVLRRNKKNLNLSKKAVS